MGPKDWAQAIAILVHAQQELDAEYQSRLRLIEHAKNSIQARWDAFQIEYDTYMATLQEDTPQPTADKVRRSFARQVAALEKYKREVERTKRRNKRNLRLLNR